MVLAMLCLWIVATGCCAVVVLLGLAQRPFRKLHDLCAYVADKLLAQRSVR
jgi:hypothetical protein